MSVPAELKLLRTRESDLNSERKQLSKQIGDLQKQMNSVTSRLNAVRSDIAALVDANKGVVITEHAILRFIERVLGTDIESVMAMMMPEKTEEQIQLLRSGTFPVRDGDRNWKLKVKKGSVVTVLTEDDSE
jgi:chromosome segregation ATPase